MAVPFFRLSKNLVEFVPAGDAPHVVPPRGIAASAYAKKVPPALFLNAAASDKTRYARQVWNLCASSAQIMRAAGCSLFKREPSPRGSRLRACQKDFLTSSRTVQPMAVPFLCFVEYCAQRLFFRDRLDDPRDGRAENGVDAKLDKEIDARQRNKNIVHQICAGSPRHQRGTHHR